MTGSPDQVGWLRAYLRGRDVGCPLCGYNLRDLGSDRCPECGREVRLGVSVAEPYLRAWVTAVVALLIAAGVGVFVLCVVAKEGWPPRRMVALRVSLWAFLVAIPLAVGAVVGRRAMLRAPQAGQWAIAAGAGAFTVAAFALFVGGID
ncbi:MAG TPA: hypothetical protein VEA69_24745 [Tepidisphaeraceae bacterium]|nr:hypothetical protein [Tepidisphaeraceae bacterium]